MDCKLPLSGTPARLTDVVCWTRMQSEAGQDLAAIFRRKEMERVAGGGLFFWGIGNAPNRSVRALAAGGDEIDVVFSLMKSRPKAQDAAPTGLLMWQTYFDSQDVEHSLPAHVIITSRLDTASTSKRSHYALMCFSTTELRLEDHGPFDPSAYRNISAAGGPVGASQVTALVVRTQTPSCSTSYRINFQAKLTGSYWVRLGSPCRLTCDATADLFAASSSFPDFDAQNWTSRVSRIRNTSETSGNSQTPMFR